MTAVVYKETRLMAEPNYNGEPIAVFNPDDKVVIKQRKSAWTKVEAGENAGWLQTLSLRAIRLTSDGKSGDALASLTNKVASKREVVATLGVRGLEEEALLQAEFNIFQLLKLESYKVTDDNLSKFASSAGLISRDVAYIDSKGLPLKGR